MARYGQAFKDKAVARLLPPESASIETVGRELSISVTTLERWRAETSHDQTVIRSMLILITLLVVAQGVTFVWMVERTQAKTDERLQALESRVDKLEKVAY